MNKYITNDIENYLKILLNNKKIVMINPVLKIQTEGNILLDYKFLGKWFQKNQIYYILKII